MLYSQKIRRESKSKKQGLDSYLDGSKIFTGTYWDEFALTHTGLQDPEVLILECIIIN